MPIHENARQCAYTMVNGTRCGGPAWEEHPHCYHHFGLKSRCHDKKITIPPLDDQNAVQVAIMDALNGMLTGRLDRADTYTLLYGIQVARTNLKGLTLVPPPPETIAEMLAAAKAEGRAEAEKQEKEVGWSLAEHLLRCRGEESTNSASQSKISDILVDHGRPPIIPTNAPDATGPKQPTPSLASDPAFSPELLSAKMWDKKKSG